MHRAWRRTFIFAYVLERKGETCVFALDNAHLAECALADDSQQPEVVEPGEPDLDAEHPPAARGDECGRVLKVRQARVEAASSLTLKTRP